jgi:hypothetical protein
MTFTLTIELGNEAVQHYGNLGRTLESIGLGLARGDTRQPSPGDHSYIRDENGNHVGEWTVTNP